MNDVAHAIAIVGVGAILPDAPNAAAFWKNVKTGRYSISDVTKDRWDSSLYYDPDPAAPDKTYSKIGGWVREFEWEPMKWHLPIPPRVANSMDLAQKWAVGCTHEALEDYGYPKRPLDLDRTAVILGNAMAGEKHYLSSMRVFFPEYARELAATSTFSTLPADAQRVITRELQDRMGSFFDPITEDTMPGELSNCVAGRIANLFNFHGPNYVCDAACASTMAAMSAAVEGLMQNRYDVAVTGGIDRNMGAPTFVKFCKIGALSPTGSRPYAQGADGFVMGEGAVVFLLKRLADAERDHDKVYAVIRGIGGSSDGRGKGITAPNPVGQKFCLERAWQNAGLSPATATLIEGHGTSTKVGDVVEAQSMLDILAGAQLPAHSIALGSVKSNIGHLKSAAGAAGILKAALALHDKVLPPSLNCATPSPDIDFAHSPLYVNTELTPWEVPADQPRRAGVSAFGFGGTNFHVVMEEHIPGKLNGNGKRSIAIPALPPEAGKDVMQASEANPVVTNQSAMKKVPLRGALVLGASSSAELVERLRSVQKAAIAGNAPAPCAPAESDLRASERIAIDYSDAADLATKTTIALKAFESDQPAFWKAIRAQGIFRGHGPTPKVAFLYTGQGSQYVNMLQSFRRQEPIVAETFAEADRIMTPILGKPLSEYIFVEGGDPEAVAKAEDDLRQTAITQPAILATDLAMTRLLGAYGIKPDMTMGHSLGEYGALVASGALPFSDALEAVSARGREMTRVSMGDNGKMVAVFAPLTEIERILKTVDGYVVVANVNSESQAVIGGATAAVEKATELFVQAGYNIAELPVSHAFHTSIVAPASEPLKQVLRRLRLQSPAIPIVANLNGEFYPTGTDVASTMVDILGQQVASPVQFVKGLRTLYDAGARVFIEVGPKKALQGFAEEVLGSQGDVLSLFTNHPKLSDTVAFNQALCGLYAAGFSFGTGTTQTAAASPTRTTSPVPVSPSSNGDRYNELGHLFADVLERGWEIYKGKQDAPTTKEPVAITGAALGLPGTEHVFDDTNVARVLRGDQFIGTIPQGIRQSMVEKHVTRLVKSETGTATFSSISELADVIKLAGRAGTFDLAKEFGVSAERLAALDRTTCLAMAAGLEAMRDAGIPLVMRYKTTSKGTKLPDRWGLPDSLRDDTGVIFASAFPGYDAFEQYVSGFHTDRARREQLKVLEHLRAQLDSSNGNASVCTQIDKQIAELHSVLEKEPYTFDRLFLFRILSMGHSQFAEFIGARGPNTQINAACASTSQALNIAEDWIRTGRCRRVIVISADDATSDHMMEWIGAGFLASGAAATDESVEDAAIPFDRRRHGLIVGMGAAAMVVESAEAARERGIRPICELLSGVVANSAFHGSRLDVQHIGQMMQDLVSKAEANCGISRKHIAPHTVFVSHETYTPARGGSASAEIYALRQTFGDAADQIVIANTKGMTGHAMGTGIEEVVAVKALETGCVPPVANFKEIDPELGALNLSKGGKYDIEYALRLAAGFGSQVSMTLMRWVKSKDGTRPAPNALGYAYRIADPVAWNRWLSEVAGYPTADLEVVNRTLRVRDQNTMARAAAASATTSPVVAPPPTAPAPTVRAAVADLMPAPKVPEPAKVNASVPAAAASVKPNAASGTDEVKNRILSLVVEKTGYPADMLDLDLDLEADLGVDTVKQAEIFAAIRERYNIPRDDARKLRDYPTLAHVIRFVYEKRPDLAAAPSTTPVSNVAPASAPVATVETPIAPVIAPAATGGGNEVKQRILELVVEKTGYPKDMLDLDLDLEADLGVDTVKQAEMFAAIREMYNIPRNDNRKLRDYPTLNHVINFVFENRPDLLDTASPISQIATPEPSNVEPPVPTQSAPASTSATNAVKDRILELVVEKTGYPKDMLDLDLDLEADLGVDTVKQAEMFAAIREMYNIPRNDNRKLRDYPTLNHVINFVYENRPDLVETVSQPSTVAAPATPKLEQPLAPTTSVVETPAGDGVKERILELVVEKTGYPKDMLDLDLDLEADLGVDTVKQAEMFAAIREMYNIPRNDNRKLRDYPTLKHVLNFVYENRPDLASATSLTTPETPHEVDHIATVTETTSPAPSVPTSPVLEDDSYASIKERILQIVAEKTGYPTDMLDLDLDLEADLGVDTVKQAEMFAAVRAAYNIPRDESMKLRDFPTLAHVIKFAQTRRPQAAPSIPDPIANVTAVKEEPSAEVPVSTTPTATANFEAADRVPRRVPVPNLRPPLELCKPTGVTLASGDRIVMMPDRNGVADKLSRLLREQGVEILRINPTHKPEKQIATLKSWCAAKPVKGVYWLAALDQEPALNSMDLKTWHKELQVRVKSLYATMRMLYEQVATRGTFLVSATRFGGQHGYDAAGAVAPLGGATCGFTKAYKRERPDATVKVVDFELNASDIADVLVQETLWDNGAVEIGYKDGLRWTIGLHEQSVADGQPALELNKDTVFLVTGAAGSIVSAIASDLATGAGGGTFYLLDMVPEPDPNNPDLKRFVTDKDGLKRDLFARIQARGERATPALVEKELAGLERAQAALAAIEAVRHAGGTAHYHSVNLTDADSVANVIEEVRQRSGHIDVLLHAAGVERSHFLTDKEPREFDLVFDVKADGWFNLLHAMGDMPLGATVAFSSIAGRFGNGGQTDYSSANDLLCKFTSNFRTTRPNTRGIAIDWTAWGGIGMATRGSIPKMMEIAGIDMLPPQAGVPYIRRELTCGGTRGEVVVADRLGAMLNEWDPTGGLDSSALESFAVRGAVKGPMVGKLASIGIYSGLTVETTLDPKQQPFLYDHRIDGTPVLPGVMGIEAFAEAVLSMLPGWHIEAIEDVNFLAPFKFYRDEPRTVSVRSIFSYRENKLVAECSLIGLRSLPTQSQPQETVHFTARVTAVRTSPQEASIGAPKLDGEAAVQASQIYRIYFHGPAYQVLERAWWDGTRIVGAMSTTLPENHEPSELPTLMAPRLIELCFQTAGIFEIGTHSRFGLPRHVESVSCFRVPKPNNGPLYALVTPRAEQDKFDAEVVDASGTLYVRLRGYSTVALPAALDGQSLEALHALMAPKAVDATA